MEQRAESGQVPTAAENEPQGRRHRQRAGPGARPAEEAGSLTGPGSRKETRAESAGEGVADWIWFKITGKPQDMAI